MIKQLSLVFGIVFLLIGVLGFVPGVTTSDNLLLGIFAVGVIHNIIHLLSGAAAVLASRDESYAQLYFRIFGAVYAVVAIVGWIQGTTVLGIIPVNTADNILHTVLAVAILGVGFGVPKSQKAVKA